MPITKEFTIRLEDRPGTLGKALSGPRRTDINILAYQTVPSRRKGKGFGPSRGGQSGQDQGGLWISNATITLRLRSRGHAN